MRLLYIDIDSLRPDHLGCYGYAAETGRDTSPNIDAIAREGVLFRDFYTTDAPCLPSRTVFYSGRLGIQTGVVGHGGTAAEPKVEGRLRSFRDRFDEQGLARQLQRLGLHTAMISPFGQRHAAHWFYAGFNEVHNTGKMGMESAEEVWPTVDRWLKQNAAGDNWYLHINFWDPHTPYRVPAEAGEPFAGKPLPAWLEKGGDDLIARLAAVTGPHTARDLWMYRGSDDPSAPHYPRQPGEIVDRATLEKNINGYDTGVWWADQHVGKIVQGLKAAGVWEDTAIIISADHGENQGELGIFGEHGTADAGTCRIPLIVRWPGGRQGVEDSALHSNVDIAPTLMDLLGGRKQPLWDGQSFAGAITGSAAPETIGVPAPQEDIVLSQCAHVCQRSVRWNDSSGISSDGAEHRWLYMRTYHDGFHLFPQEMLFDLAADPHEQNDLAASHPALCREGAWRLARWHDAQMQRMSDNASDPRDPLWTVVAEGGPFHALHASGRSPLPAYLKRLEATGRQDGADALREKYAAYLPVSR